MLVHPPGRMRTDDHGASITEYAALIVLVGAIASVIAAGPIGRVISDNISHSICTAMGGDDCDTAEQQPVADDETPAPTDEEPAEQHEEHDPDADADNSPQPPASADSPDSSDLGNAHHADWQGVPEEVRDTQPVLWSVDNLWPFGDDEDEQQENGPELSPDPSASPEDVSDWWDELSESERQEAIREEGEHLRDRDGIPADVRDELNREHLNDEVTDMLEDEGFTREEVLDADRDDVESWFSFGEPSEELYELVELEQELRSAEEFDHHLLALDTDEDRAIVATGNPDTADHVSTLVPGVGTDVGDVNVHHGRAQNLHRAAEMEGDEGEDHASIAWLGYDAPNWGESPFSGAAEGGTQDLQEFQQGLEATHEAGDSTNSVVGHSYGSVVVGHAARESELDADQLLLAGSPGVGGELDELEFNGDIEDIHVLESDDDWISDWNAGHSYDDLEHGQESRHDFDLDDEVGHSGYFDNPEADWMRYMGDVIASD